MFWFVFVSLMQVFVYFGIYSLESKGCARDAAPFDSAINQLWL